MSKKRKNEFQTEFEIENDSEYTEWHETGTTLNQIISFLDTYIYHLKQNTQENNKEKKGNIFLLEEAPLSPDLIPTELERNINNNNNINNINNKNNIDNSNGIINGNGKFPHTEIITRKKSRISPDSPITPKPATSPIITSSNSKTNVHKITTTTTTTTTTTSSITSSTSTSTPSPSTSSNSSNKNAKLKFNINKLKLKSWLPNIESNFSKYSNQYLHDQNHLPLLYTNDQLITNLPIFQNETKIKQLQLLRTTLQSIRQNIGITQKNKALIPWDTLLYEVSKFSKDFPSTLDPPLNDHFGVLNYIKESGESYFRPYLTPKARKFITNNDNAYKFYEETMFYPNFRDIYHFPFEKNEIEILHKYNINKNTEIEDLKEVSKNLIGRTPIDIFRFINSNEYDQPTLDSDSESSDNSSISSKSSNSSNNNNNNNKNNNNNNNISLKSFLNPTKIEKLEVSEEQIFLDLELGLLNSNQYKHKIVGNRIRGSLERFDSINVSCTPVLDTKFDPTGRTNKVMILCKGPTYGGGYIYDYKSQAKIQLDTSFGENYPIEARFSVDGKHLLKANDYSISNFDTSTGKEKTLLAKLTDSKKCLRLNTHPTENILAAALFNKTIQIINYDTGKIQRLNEPKKPELPVSIMDVAFGYGNYSNKVAVGIGNFEDSTPQGFVVVYDYNKIGRYVVYDDQKADVSTLCWNPKIPGVLISGSNNINRSICIYDIRLKKNNPISIYKTGQTDLNIVTVSPDGNYVTSSGSQLSTFVFDIRLGNKILFQLPHEIPRMERTELVPNENCNHAVWNGNYLYTCAYDVKIWDVTQSNPLIKRIKDHEKGPVNYIDITPQGDMLVSGGDDGSINLYKL